MVVFDVIVFLGLGFLIELGLGVWFWLKNVFEGFLGIRWGLVLMRIILVFIWIIGWVFFIVGVLFVVGRVICIGCCDFEERMIGDGIFVLICRFVFLSWYFDIFWVGFFVIIVCGFIFWGGGLEFGLGGLFSKGVLGEIILGINIGCEVVEMIIGGVGWGLKFLYSFFNFGYRIFWNCLWFVYVIFSFFFILYMDIVLLIGWFNCFVVN